MVVKEEEKKHVDDVEMEDASADVKDETNSEEQPQEEVEEEAEEQEEEEEEEEEQTEEASTTSSSGSPSSKKRKASSILANAEESNQETEEGETQPQKKAKGKRGRKKGAAPTKGKKGNAAEEDDEEQLLEDLKKRIGTLEPEIQGLLGNQCWCRMQGYPFWPAVVIDPRKMQPGKMRKPAINALKAKKFWIFFYGTNNFAPMPFKNVVPWDDTKFDYRSGYPESSAKAPKRRESLMDAIEAADVDGKLPLEERALGVMRPVEIVPKVEKKAKAPTPTSASTAKKGKGKAHKQTKIKAAKKVKDTVQDEEEEEDKEDEEDDEGQEESEAEAEDSKSSLSMDEIKAKVASRKAPSKKAPKAPKAPGQKKTSAGKSSKSLDSAEFDFKRKKEIELVVPRQSVKSPGVKQMTEEDMKKQMGLIAKKVREDEKDKIEYKVGSLATFAKNLTCLFSNESAQNNVQVMTMLKELFQEKVVYRSDVERSGLAAIVAALRKSTNPNVAQTASALRKHLMKNLKDDTSKQDKGSKDSSTFKAPVQVQGKEKEKKKEPVVVTSPKSVKKEVVEKKEKPTKPNIALTSPSQKVESTSVTSTSTTATPTAQNQPKEIPQKEEISLEPARKASREMFEQVLKENGKKGGEYEKKAKELEMNLYERFKSISDEYMTQVRLVTFGLRGDKSMCERILTDKIKTLEFAYANHSFFKS